MKLFVLLSLFLLVPFAAEAQTLVSRETANTYFQNCVNSASPQPFSQNGLQMLCGCTAARMTQFFTMEDMKAMTGNDPATARPAYNKMIINIYAPCMEEPTREYHYNACMQNPQTSKLGNPEHICRCAANELGTYMKLRGSELFAKILARDPNIVDPVSALFNDPEFQTIAQSKAIGCMQ